jgi:phospholipid/cholesterol/gamma-HCH transport system ATP-binding protein
LLGPAGVGKSVLLKLVNGLLRPDQGSILLFGEEISHMPEQQLFPLRTRIGMVFQEGALFDSLSVRDNVAYQLIQEQVPDEEIDQRVRDALRFVELEETFDLFPASLSGGMRRRVAIARALIRTPELLLYDSPTGGLDPLTSTTIIELIVKERDVSHTPSLMVTHRLQDAFILCNHRFDLEQGRMVHLPKGQTDPGTTFLMLENGRLIFDGSLHELVKSRNPFVREFLE